MSKKNSTKISLLAITIVSLGALFFIHYHLDQDGTSSANIASRNPTPKTQTEKTTHIKPQELTIEAPQGIEPEALALVEKFNKKVAGITQEDIALEKKAIDDLRQEHQEKARFGELVIEEKIALPIADSTTQFTAIKKEYPDGEIRYELPNTYDPLNDSAGWE